jgi:adenylosuccinate synthase
MSQLPTRYGDLQTSPDQAMRVPAASYHHRMHLVLLSGPVCAGKTTLAAGLQERMRAHVLATREVIVERTATARDDLHRGRLQQLGAALDRAEGGYWVADAVRERFGGGDLVVVDAVRTPDQAAAVRALDTTLHAHLTAPPEVLARRYDERAAARPALELPSFAAVRADPTEAGVALLAPLADLVLDSNALDGAAVLERVAAALR